ncbi:rap guanine nucleotide exchange factor 2 isoform X2 [Lutzomyia longipalpis]|uniref:rap guanine nucleotide exchange factor 2 isoform X2 n=1 Tax=Lutzomyia longipalpis TaxID=7200 RepID=UPI00248350A9|nr:rap guanine nucleotide exchange factor 2 isoform X2 [Lutzomyia longipalpis]
MPSGTFIDHQFIDALCCDPDKRTLQDLQLIYYGLRSLEPLSNLRDSVLRSLCKVVRYERHNVNEILYYTGELSTCWYILLSGAVFINGSMFLPGSSFGKRNGGSCRRPSECFVLESSEMIVIDYPEVTSNVASNQHLSPSTAKVARGRCERGMDQSQQRGGSAFNIIYTDVDTGHQSRPELYQKCNRGSHSSDTSSAYSGSDTMTSVHSSSIDADEVDLSGLVESVVDSDEEDLAESMDSLTVRDTVRECLEKDPTDRTEDDIETLLEFTQKLKAFTSLTLAVRRALCSVMVFAVVEKAGTMVMNDGEELDSWSVLINGHVEIEHANGEHEELQVGDSFGILPTMDKLYHQGVMRTKCDDCQFVCITQTDYYRIQHQGEENTKRHEDNGQLVMITELRHGLLDAGTRRGHVVIRGTPERLMLQLIEENSMTDPTYVEDFLLTYRTFIENPNQVAQQLLTWFENEDTSPSTCSATPTEIRDRVTRTVILWVNNHFTDFEFDGQMMEFLEAFEVGLEKKAMEGQLRLLHIACAAKARTRVVTLTRSSRDEPLHFEISGGSERGGLGVFVIGVERRTKAEEVGFKRGDQILEVNGNSLEHVTLARALELLRSTTHLSVTLRSNLLAFREMLATPECLSPQRSRPARRRVVPDLQDPRARLSAADLIAGVDQADAAMRVPASPPAIPNPPPMGPLSAPPAPSAKSSSGFMTLAPKRRLQKALIKMNLLPKNSLLLATEGSIDAESPPPVPNTVAPGSGGDNSSTSSGSSQSVTTTTPSTSGPTIYHSQSNPDLSTYYDDNRAADYPEHVLKVYKADQTCKYLLVHKETTAHEVVMLALQEFGIHETSSNFSLCEVSVGEGGMVKQRRLPDQMQNLAERIGLSARYYLKTNGITETLVPDDVAAELVRENVVHFLQLNANEVAMQLTFQDFAIFRQIESTEYIDDLFELRSPYGTPMLKQFAELVNREMFWVVTEICSEGNIVRRMKIIKQFVKVARHCKECRNFNSMFAIVSGLGHAAVSRLRATWDKLPSKYQKLFGDLQELMDPSRNMSKYRQLVSTELVTQHPIIPFYPVVKKDLTFIHLGNDSRIEGLINFEKLRMIAKEVRSLAYMCNSPNDLLTMLELRGQPPSSAMVALNQMSVATSGGGTSNFLGGGQATVKRRKKSTAAPNPKKMFEEAQMVRRVKAYLNNMKVTTDEDALHALSAECEPSGGSAPSSVTIRKRHPSPTLSTTSSTSSTSEGKKSAHISTAGAAIGAAVSTAAASGKFGAASPQAVKKILALSEQSKTRPHHPKHPGIVLPGLGHYTSTLQQSSISPSPSPNTHRRINPSSSAGSVSYSAHSFPSGHVGGRAIHERSHSDTPTPVPSVDLSAESSSVTSLSNMPLRKTITSSSLTSSDSGHGSCAQSTADNQSNCSESNSGLYHVASSIVHNSPSPTLQQRRHSAMHGSCGLGNYIMSTPAIGVPPPPHHHPHAHGPSNSQALNGDLPYQLTPIVSPLHGSTTNFLTSPQFHSGTRYNAHPMVASVGGHGARGAGCPRLPPAYSVAAQMARLHRLGRAHSHEGVTTVTAAGNPGGLIAPQTHYRPEPEDEDEDDDEETQVSAV